MENNIPKITFAIASKNNFRYVKHAIEYIRENCYRKDHIIHIGIDGEDIQLENYYKDTDGVIITKGVSGIAAIYNDIVKSAITDFIIIYHADMIAGKNVDFHLYQSWKRGLIVSATRIEPPLHPGDPSKIVKNFGMWPEENIADGFLKDEFNEFVESNLNINKITKGVFAPWLIHKEDYWAVGGHDENLNSHSEDRDLFNRFLLNGFDFIQNWSAMVYHLTCRGGQFEHATKTEELMIRSTEWNILARNNTREFFRKWGTQPTYDAYQYPIVYPKYNIAFSVKNSNLDALRLLEPLCDRLYIEDEMGVLLSYYYDEEQKNTKFDLKKRIVSLKYNNPFDYEDIVIEFDWNHLNNNSFGILQQIGNIIGDSGGIGKFTLDIFTITIHKMEEYQCYLIDTNDNWYKEKLI